MNGVNCYDLEEPAPIFGKGIAFWLGEYCDTTCNQILFHVWCNTTTHRCECLPEYPVNVENKYCLKAIQINDRCEFTESCQYLNPNSECNQQGFCKCLTGFFVKYDDDLGMKICAAYNSPFFLRIGSTTFDFINQIEFVTLLGLVMSFILILILSIMVFKLMRKNKKLSKNDQQTPFCDMILPPPPVILPTSRPNNHYNSTREFRKSSIQSTPPTHHSPFRHSIKISQQATEFVAQDDHQIRTKSSIDNEIDSNDNNDFVVPPLPPNIGDKFTDFRRQSFSSLRSQSSLKSLSSFRSQHSDRNQMFNNLHHCQSHDPNKMIQTQSRPQSYLSSSHQDFVYHQEPSYQFDDFSSPDNNTKIHQSNQCMQPMYSSSFVQVLPMTRIKCNSHHRCSSSYKNRNAILH
ncbi:nuclear pore complex protein Nup98-Nup96-like [Sarcoptes scabiei]|nr:nuclear pore complex protein Nup98-Nup96-like [Sarcoptes scabiei]